MLSCTNISMDFTKTQNILINDCVGRVSIHITEDVYFRFPSVIKWILPANCLPGEKFIICRAIIYYFYKGYDYCCDKKTSGNLLIFFKR